MRVGAIMIPREKLTCISMGDTLEKAMKTIDEQNLLSLPVVSGSKFVGVLSKQYTYEMFFKEYNGTREDFLQQPVETLMALKLETVTKDIRIEEAAALFISSKVRFIAVVDGDGNLEGLVTQQAIFKQYQKMFGHKHNSLVIYTYDYRGVIAKITDIIAKNGGDIRNMMMFHTDVLELVEIFLRIEAEDFDRIIKALQKNGLDIRDVKRA